MSATGSSAAGPSRGDIVLFLGGDVVTARGIDQILPHPSDPILFEPYLRSARGYVELAEAAGASIPRPASFAYVWGDALKIWAQMRPDARIVNLETSISRSDDYWRGKGVNYRMSPKNIQCLTEAEIDACAVANNHVLDWGYSGLRETLSTLETAHIKWAGAGRNQLEAAAPCIVTTKNGRRLLLWSFATLSSGVPALWAATEDRPGINVLLDLGRDTAQSVAGVIRAHRRPGHAVVLSIHWGTNWDFTIPADQREFAHGLIESGTVDVVHGHSSHHVKGIEVYRGKLILYGCGDLLNDYEGIRGFEDFRGDLGLMYFARLAPVTAELLGLRMFPTRIRDLRVNRATKDDVTWLKNTLNREGRPLGTGVTIAEDGSLFLRWDL